MNPQIQFSINDELPNKVRFKNCIKGDCEPSSINHCYNRPCWLAGNYDIDGWRYDIIRARNLTYIITNEGVQLILSMCDWYTFIPPDPGFQAIL